MADVETVWQAGGIGDFNLTQNWSNGVPGAAADKVGVLNGTSAVSLVKNLDQSGAPNAFKIKSARDYLGDIGGPANPLVIVPVAAGLTATIRSPGNSYIKFDGLAVVSDILVDVENGFVQVESLSGAGPLIDNLMVKSGRVTIVSNCTITRLFASGTNIHITIEPANSGFSGPSLMHLGGATVVSARDLSTTGFINLGSGRFRLTGLLVGNAQVHLSGGYFNYNPVDDPSGETPKLIVKGGWLDLSDYPGAIVASLVIQGVGARLTGTVIQGVAALRDYDLNEDWPQ